MLQVSRTTNSGWEPLVYPPKRPVGKIGRIEIRLAIVHGIFNWTRFQGVSVDDQVLPSRLSRGGCRPWFGQMSDANGSTASVWLTLSPDPAYTTWRCCEQQAYPWLVSRFASDGLDPIPDFSLVTIDSTAGLHLSFAFVEEWSTVELYSSDIFTWYTTCISFLLSCVGEFYQWWW